MAVYVSFINSTKELIGLYRAAHGYHIFYAHAKAASQQLVV